MTSAARSILRPAVPADLPGISALLSAAFHTAPDAPFLNPALMEWKYWAPRGDWTEPRAYVLEKNGRFVAFAGLCPMVFGAGRDAIRGVHMIDWAAAEDTPGAGLTLVKKLAELFDFILAIGGSEATLKVLPAFGFEGIGSAWTAARPLRPLLQILTHQRRNWKLAPRLARNTLMAMSGDGSVHGFRARPLDPAGIDAGWLASSPGASHFAPRPPAFFEYLLRCPGATFSLHTIESGSGAQEGFFVLSVVRHQARIVGIWLQNPAAEAFHAAYSLARRTAAKSPGAAELVASGSGEMSRGAAAKAGFRILGEKPVLLLNRTKRFQFSPEFQFQLSEDDHGWLDIGSADYWT